MFVHFVHSGSAYLPELSAYVDFIHTRGGKAVIHHHPDSLPGSAQVIWWMCGLVPWGTDRRFSSAFHIHEYSSASIGKLRKLKDTYKRWVQPKPDYRVFQNAWVRDCFRFSDNVPYEYRDMGIANDFFNLNSILKPTLYDFVYVGDIDRLKHFMPFLHGLSMAKRTALLIGDVSLDMHRLLGRIEGIHMHGRTTYSNVPSLLRKARFGLNLIPDEAPYNMQTSTKLLEYCAVGLNVVSTKYKWVAEFERKHDAKFSYVPYGAEARQYANLMSDRLDQISFSTPDVTSLAWHNFLGDLQVWKAISTFNSGGKRATISAAT